MLQIQEKMVWKRKEQGKGLFICPNNWTKLECTEGDIIWFSFSEESFVKELGLRTFSAWKEAQKVDKLTFLRKMEKSLLRHGLAVRLIPMDTKAQFFLQLVNKCFDLITHAEWKDCLPRLVNADDYKPQGKKTNTRLEWNNLLQIKSWEELYYR